MQKKKYIINHRGLPLGDSHITLEYGADLFAAYPESGVENGEGIVEIDVIKHTTMLELSVIIKGSVEVECDRCIALYTQPIDYTSEVIVKLSENEGDYDGDIIWLNPREDELDLAQWIFESIILSLPIQRVHENREDCDPEALKYITGTVDSDEIDED